MRLEGEQWAAYFRSFERSAFRLEVQPVYTMPWERETVDMFLAGQPMPDDFNVEWHDVIRSNVEQGRTMTRAKVLRRPYTDYTRYLLEWCIPGNVAAGEDYQIVDLTDVADPGFPDQDYWFFDDRTVVDMLYRSDGTQIGRELRDDPDLEFYRRWRDEALAMAVPFKEYANT